MRGVCLLGALLQFEEESLLIVQVLRFALRRKMSAGGGHRADANAPRIALETGPCFPPGSRHCMF